MGTACAFNYGKVVWLLIVLDRMDSLLKLVPLTSDWAGVRDFSVVLALVSSIAVVELLLLLLLLSTVTKSICIFSFRSSSFG